MSRFGIRKRLKSAIGGVVGKTDDTTAPNWQNRTTSEVYRSARAPSPEPVKTEAPAPAPVVEEPPAPEPVAEVAAPVAEEAPAVEEAPAEESSGMDASDDTAGPPISVEEVQEILDDMVRPALQGDGGDITLIKIEQNDIYVKLVGACSTCPSSIMTMKMGVEALLKEEFPHMRELIQMD